MQAVPNHTPKNTPPTVRACCTAGAIKMGRCRTSALVAAVTITTAYVSVLRFEAQGFLYGSRTTPTRRRRQSLEGLGFGHRCFWAPRRAPPCIPTAVVVRHCPSSSNSLHVKHKDGAPTVRLSAAGGGVGGGEESNALLLRMDFEHAEVQELREWIRR